ncbi:NAD(P)/FAD-dependent oxidoreductase [Peristeroidobacter soli]|uniref:NAD(P)/FAD-dependent oxidoreductase n=1 Tax=Peristeroidobacter soli TaxID=2497877 RepID=UPI00101C03AE|nr:FAD/NAD(P)-binding oxidoreductase [Peristeroidobacter soli]
MAHVIVIGAGIGGVPAAYELRKKLGKQHAVTLIGASPYFEFTPSNPWVAVGWRQCEQTRVALQEPLQAKGVQWIAERVDRIDADTRRLQLSGGRELDYDYLVIATGPKLAFDEVPGLGPAGFTQSVCTQEHAAQTWQKYQEFIKDPGAIVIGAAAGASCFGPAYEFAMIVDADLRKRKLRDRVPITFVTSEPYIGHMGLGGVGDSKGLMESELRQRHIKWLTNAKITRVESGSILAVEHDEDGKPKKEHEVPFKYAMVIPAFKGVDAVAAVPGLCNPRGFVLIDMQQRSTKYPNIFSAGVCVAIPPVEATPVPTGAPKTGYMIESMVSALVENIAADIDGKSATAQATWNAVCLADFGDTGAAFVALPEIPPRNVTWAGVGKWVHLAKIAFEKYFLRKVRTGSVTPIYERYVLKLLGIVALKERPQ